MVPWALMVLWMRLMELTGDNSTAHEGLALIVFDFFLHSMFLMAVMGSI